MKNTFGNSISVTLFGESHGPAIGATIDGLAPGIPVEDEIIKKYLSRRRPSSLTDTARKEPDNYQIVSGVFNGKTTGTPITIIIPNENTKSRDYNYGPARPSHADYTAYQKYHGFEDYRGGGHFSGRITAALTAVGGILIPMLEKCGINIGTHILRCNDAADRAFGVDTKSVLTDIESLKEASFPVLEAEAGRAIEEVILAARSELDSVGGITQTAITGLPAGLGEPWFDSVESQLSHIVFSLGGVKGIEFGKGFGFADLRGSAANDPMRMKDGTFYTTTNNNAGINGGITNGMPVIFQCAVKPTPSIYREQQTINFLEGTETTLSIEGRHDPAIIRRICPVLDSVAAIVIADMLASRYGTDVLNKEPMALQL